MKNSIRVNPRNSWQSVLATNYTKAIRISLRIARTRQRHEPCFSHLNLLLPFSPLPRLTTRARHAPMQRLFHLPAVRPRALTKRRARWHDLNSSSGPSPPRKEAPAGEAPTGSPGHAYLSV